MEATFYEDPACNWCWAFQPVFTAFSFEFGSTVKTRTIMGGLRDLPVTDVDFTARQWKMAAEISGMPFDFGFWKEHSLATTFPACRAVKAASILGEEAAHRLLRRLREAHFTECAPIDDLATIWKLCKDVGLDADLVRENMSNGRAETLFARDRLEATRFAIALPAVVLRGRKEENPVVLQGTVPYEELIHALQTIGAGSKLRRRFEDRPEDWESLFSIHSRLTLAEIQQVVPLEKSAVLGRLRKLGFHKSGPFYTREADRESAPVPVTNSADRPAPETREDPAAEHPEEPSE